MTALMRQQLIDRHAHAAGFTADDVRGSQRSRRLAQVRQAIAVELRMAGYSLLDIGRELHKDHTSILYLLRRGPIMSPQPRARRVDWREGLGL